MPVSSTRPATRSPDAYVDTFNARGDLYNAAAKISPAARNIERDLLIQMLDVHQDHTVCDAPAGGGFLADGLRGLVRDPRKIVCVEPSQRFSEPVSADYTLVNSPISSIPVEDSRFDRIGSLAGLHHVDNKLPFFREASRVLKPDGLIVVADVLQDSPVARFLNGPVDQYTQSGHKGLFIRPGEYFRWFEQSGIQPILEKQCEFCWRFDSVKQMIDYCQSLFGLVRATSSQVQEALYRHFKITTEGDHVMLPWALIYGVGRKADLPG